MKRGLVLLGLLAACRTEIAPIVRHVEPTQARYTKDKECNVHDYPNATDLPTASRNLGWVEVERSGTDEETYTALYTKICSLGGDAMSQLAWVKESGESDATKLRANAWELPE